MSTVSRAGRTPGIVRLLLWVLQRQQGRRGTKRLGVEAGTAPEMQGLEFRLSQGIGD